MKTSTRVVVGALLAFILVASGFAAGFVVSAMITQSGGGGVPAPTVNAGADATLGSKLDEVQRVVKSEALAPPNDTSATAGAIQGFLSSNGDKYATYFDTTHLKAFNEQTQGSFGGIGVVLGETSGTATVLEVYKGTPAEKGGVKKGDVFRTINKETRTKWPTEDVVKRVRGPQGTPVTITMYRASDKRLHKFTLTRAQIKVPNVDKKLVGKVGYIRFAEFNANAETEVKAAIKDLTKQGAKSFVLDLRDNPGGLLEQAVDVSSLFIKDGVIVRVDERNRPEEVYQSTGRLATSLPLVVLVNENSASASEITGGALQDHKRATLVGVKSYGKGSVQNIRNLSFGGAIKFTIAHYLTPNKRVINGKGLIPDVIIPMDFMKQGDKKTDVQYKKALEIANQLIK